MTKDEILEEYKDIPEIVKSTIDMTEANSPVKIYEGEYLLKSEARELKIIGKIIFNWVASSGSHFSGQVIKDGSPLLQFSNTNETYRVLIDGLEFGSGYINNTSFGNGDSETVIKGKILGQAVFGDKSIAVEKLIFSIPNLRDFHGFPVKTNSASNFSISSNRIVLENEHYLITIDKCKDFKIKINSLDEKGGFNITYYGELTIKKGTIKLEESSEIFHCLSTFLTFINGRRTSAFFIQGIFENEVIWCDFTDYLVDSYKQVQTWPQRNSVSGLSEVWKEFSLLWKDTNNKNFLISAIHWYIEANGNSGFTEGSIIMTQTALELLYNWWIIENKKMILGKDSENISASNKIRLLLSQLNIPHTVPPAFNKLQQFIDETENITDAPEGIVQIRNAIVHSQQEKRNKLFQIDYMAKHQASQLSIWYIEMTLLRILNFDDKYFNRCAKSVFAFEAEINVPWTKSIDSIKPTANIGIANSGADGKTMSFWKSVKQWFGLTNKAKH